MRISLFFLLLLCLTVSSLPSSPSSPLAVPSPASALVLVKIKAEVDKAIAKVNDEIIVKVTLTEIEGIGATMPELSGELGGLRIVEFGSDPERREDKEVTYKKWYKLKADFSGTYILPALECQYKDPQSGENKIAKTSEIFIEIKSSQDNTGVSAASTGTPDSSASAATATAIGTAPATTITKGDGDIRDIKDIEKTAFKFSLFHWIILAALLILIAGIIFYYIYQQKQQKIPPPLPIPPHELAIKELRILQGQRWWESDEKQKNFHFSLSLIIRNYLEGQFLFTATDMTIEEIKYQIDQLNLHARGERWHRDPHRDPMNANDFHGKISPSTSSEGLKHDLLKLLEGCDLVKFTDYLPPKETGEKLLDLATNFIYKTRPVVAIESTSATKDRKNLPSSPHSPSTADEEETII